MLSLIVAFIAFFATGAVAAPASSSCRPQCSTASIKLSSINSTDFANPSTPPTHVFAAIGVQNYTCADTGKFASAGAVATLVDASCMMTTMRMSPETIADTAFRLWNLAPTSSSPAILQTLAKLQNRGSPVIAAHHFFTKTPTGNFPVWDMRATGGGPNAYVVASKVANAPASTNPQKDVDWLSLKGVEGNLAAQIFRTDTRGGQPPASCTPNATLSVKYASLYYLYGGSA